ncbi:MAG: sulfatase-like hydrolase/transferase, partial [Planctomycetota bacterium]
MPYAYMLLGLALMVPDAAWAAHKVQAPDPPNVLFIAIDDLRPSLGCYGDTLVRSPHIDRLAETGLRFRRAYCQQAVCGPSRTSVLTGLLPDKTHVWHNRNLFRDTLPDAVTLPQLFKNHGYHTQSLGKVFSGRTREDDPASWSVPSVLIGEGWQSYVLPENQGSGKQ